MCASQRHRSALAEGCRASMSPPVWADFSTPGRWAGITAPSPRSTGPLVASSGYRSLRHRAVWRQQPRMLPDPRHPSTMLPRMSASHSTTEQRIHDVCCACLSVNPQPRETLLSRRISGFFSSRALDPDATCMRVGCDAREPPSDNPGERPTRSGTSQLECPMSLRGGRHCLSRAVCREPARRPSTSSWSDRGTNCETARLRPPVLAVVHLRDADTPCPLRVIRALHVSPHGILSIMLIMITTIINIMIICIIVVCVYCYSYYCYEYYHDHYYYCAYGSHCYVHSYNS